ncbi:L,D-transpeptidase [Patescibacteria group bacterium]|nr:L,D-transpeptidase [Patescibacteria group bacterium]
MKIRLFFLILILAVAVTGLFLSCNQIKSETQSSKSETNQIEVGPLSDLPQGDAGVKKQINVDLEQQRMFLYENGEFVKEFVISSGKIDTTTPAGKFRIIHKQDMVYSKIAGCWLGFWVGFTNDGKHGFHETPICDGEREGEDTMGTPVSLGCIRLKLGDAEQLYNWAEIETPIEIF